MTLVVLLALLPAGLWILRLSYQTLGEVHSGLIAFVLMVSAIPVVLLLVFQRPRLAARVGGTVVLLTGILPLFLSYRLEALHQEARSVVTTLAFDARSQGSLPTELPAAFVDPELRRFILYSGRGDHAALKLDPGGTFSTGYHCTVQLHDLLDGVRTGAALPCTQPEDWFFEAD